MNKELFGHYAWIYRGKQRKIILQALHEPKTPTKLKEETQIKVTNVSDVLRSMAKRKLVKCLNPNDKLGRFYELTLLGKKVREKIVK